MSTSNRAMVEGRMLLWARSTTRTPIEVAAKAAGVSKELLQDWENNTRKPTIRQLRLLAHKYRFPLAVFFLPEPLDYYIPHVRDFRSLEKQGLLEYEHLILAEVRSAFDRRQVFLELQDPLPPITDALPFGISTGQNPRKLASTIRSALALTLEEQTRWRTQSRAFSRIRDFVENAGVLVFQTSEIDLSILRGYSLNFLPAPVIVVNRKDAYAGRSFTVLHELAHILSQSSALCDLSTRNLPESIEKHTEIFCNSVAAETLVPSDDFLVQDVVANHGHRTWEDIEIDSLAKRYGSSKEVIVRKLLDYGIVSQSFYEEKRKQYKEEFEESRRRAQSKKGGYIRPARNATSLLGGKYIETLFVALDQGRITLNDFSDFTNIKLKHLDELRSIA